MGSSGLKRLTPPRSDWIPHGQQAARGVDRDPAPDVELAGGKSGWVPVFRATVLLGRSGTIRETGDSIFWVCSLFPNCITGQGNSVPGGDPGGLSEVFTFG